MVRGVWVDPSQPMRKMHASYLYFYFYFYFWRLAHIITGNDNFLDCLFFGLGLFQKDFQVLLQFACVEQIPAFHFKQKATFFWKRDSISVFFLKIFPPHYCGLKLYGVMMQKDIVHLNAHNIACNLGRKAWHV